MADIDLSNAAGPRPRGFSFTRLLASPKFQSRMVRLPFVGRFVRREGEAMFDLVAGFCHAQILQAVVKLGVLDLLLDGPLSTDILAARCDVPRERMQILLDASASLKLLKKRASGFALTTRGAALIGVPGLRGMIEHHDVLYRDLSDPVAFFRGETTPELASFWPYVFGAASAKDPTIAATYSKLMTDSQALVAEDTLAAVSLTGVRQLMDVGGGAGAFLTAAAQVKADMSLVLFDLPAVVPAASERFNRFGLSKRTVIQSGSFRDDPLPLGADMISLVRVLYDHADDTVLTLLKSARAALPPNGRILVSEPMTGGEAPFPAGDAYFALYCLAMETGKARSAKEIEALLAQAGFSKIKIHASRRPFITTAITAVNLA